MKRKSQDFVTCDEPISLGQALGIESIPPSPCPCHPANDAVGRSDWKKSKIRLSLTRAGRGGKTVTLVKGIEKRWATQLLSDLKKQLGVGGGWQDEDFFLAGDQRDRLVTWFVQQGARDVR